MAVPTPLLFSTVLLFTYGHALPNNQGFPGKQIRVAAICQAGLTAPHLWHCLVFLTALRVRPWSRG